MAERSCKPTGLKYWEKLSIIADLSDPRKWQECFGFPSSASGRKIGLNAKAGNGSARKSSPCPSLLKLSRNKLILP